MPNMYLWCSKGLTCKEPRVLGRKTCSTVYVLFSKGLIDNSLSFADAANSARLGGDLTEEFAAVSMGVFTVKRRGSRPEDRTRHDIGIELGFRLSAGQRARQAVTEKRRNSSEVESEGMLGVGPMPENGRCPLAENGVCLMPKDGGRLLPENEG